jgi:hypothetical protein
MSFKDLLRRSDPARIDRSKKVRAKSLLVTTIDEKEAWTFSYKSFPSTTGKRWNGNIRFFKENVSNADAADDLECQVDCNCFAGETKVLMGDGTYKHIKDITIGEMVYTHKGRIRKVIKNNIRNIKSNENVYKIKIGGFPGNVLVTGEHPFYTLRGNETCQCGCNESLWEGDVGKFKSEKRLLSPNLILSKNFKQGHSAKIIERNKCG